MIADIYHVTKQCPLRYKKYISLDDKNQYLIIGRNPKNLFTTSDNLFELVSEKMGEQKEFSLKEYL